MMNRSSHSTASSMDWSSHSFDHHSSHSFDHDHRQYQQPPQQHQQTTTRRSWWVVPVVFLALLASVFNAGVSFSQVGLSSSFDSRIVAVAQQEQEHSHHDEETQQRLVKVVDKTNATVAQLVQEITKYRHENQQLRKRLDEMETSIQNHIVDDKALNDRVVIKQKKEPSQAEPVDDSTNKAATTTTTAVTIENHDIALGPVQAIPDLGKHRKPRKIELPPTNRKLYINISDIPHILFDNRTINPILPSEKVDAATMFNVEIPLNYSIAAPMTSTVPWSNVTTMAFEGCKFYSGYRNQMMAFTMLVMETVRQGHGQLLLASVSMKDTYGTSKQIPFARLWDVEQWNSYYPLLPRLVDYDPVLHSQFNFNTTQWYRTRDEKFGTYGLFATANRTMRPHAWGLQHKLQAGYTRYAMKGRGPYINPASSSTNSSVGFRNPTEILMMQGAMRPHPNLQAIMDRLLSQSILVGDDDKEVKDSKTRIAKENGNKKNSNNILEYMTLHARVEPDMQKHPVCRDKKVLNLTDIFAFIESKWPEPPVTKIFMPINRQYLEKEGLLAEDEATVNKNDPKINWIAVENLNALNRARDEGLWNGRVKVIEFGANALENTAYADRPSTAGAMLNFFIGIEAKIFIGTEVSSFSHDLLATRFFRNHMENYKYLPDGLHEWTPPGTIDPPGFGC